MARNNYHKDASFLFKRISKNIADNNLRTEWDVINNVLFFAIGVEKLLKSMIFDVNPLYILESPDFKNSCGFTYSGFVKNSDELSKSQNEDVIAYQSSVFRAMVFSETVTSQKNTLMKLKNARDIIVHNNFNGLDIDELRTLLKRDFYPLLSKLADEHNISAQQNFFNNLNSQLAEISSSLQSSIEEKIRLKMESSQSYWNTKKGTHTYNIKETKLKTAELLKSANRFPTECPSCKNFAVLHSAPVMEYNAYSKSMEITGFNVKALDCEFCKLNISDYKELDFLNIKPEENEELIIADYAGEMNETEEKD